MNNITLLGRLTADPELKHTANQVPVVNFTLAVDRDYTPKGEEKQADFINCVGWRHTAEFISRYFRKGQRMALTGTLQTRKYTDKDGNNRTAYEVVVNAAYFADSKQNDTSPNVSAYAPQSANTPQYGAVPGGFEEISDGEPERLPF
jgi:single-strand DNA-binding protein